MGLHLKELIRGLEVKRIRGANGISIEGIAYDSRRIKNDFLFVCIKGNNFDGHDFIIDARSAGARAFVVEKASDINNGVTEVLVPDSRAALAKLADAFYGFPTRFLKVIGVTGTDGKTTTTHYIKSILEEAGVKCGLLGTINYKIGDRIIPADRTTPESLELMAFFSQMVKAGLTHAVMEVSSHGLMQSRVDEINFELAVFTNLSHEHLDFHTTMDEYYLAKRRLFEKDIKMGIVNIDDEFGKKLKEFLGTRALGFGTSSDADYRAEEINTAMSGTRYKLKGKNIEMDINLSLIGRHNVYNSLAAICAGFYFGISPDTIAKGIEKITNIPGRFEPVKCGQSYNILVDYAHTPRALENALIELKPLTAGRLIVVFGCGGDRDKTKRPVMGKIAADLADLAIITSDNPRTEDPLRIIDDIVSGIEKKEKFLVAPDREKAIAISLRMAGADDTILLAGKGHENYQITGNIYHPFNDAEKVRAMLNK